MVGVTTIIVLESEERQLCAHVDMPLVSPRQSTLHWLRSHTGHCTQRSTADTHHHATAAASQPVLHISIINPLICNFSTFRTSRYASALSISQVLNFPSKECQLLRRSNTIIKISMKKQIIYLQKYFIYKYMSRVTLRSKIYFSQIRNCQF